jgi:hypothetical protein
MAGMMSSRSLLAHALAAVTGEPPRVAQCAKVGTLAWYRAPVIRSFALAALLAASCSPPVATTNASSDREAHDAVVDRASDATIDVVEERDDDAAQEAASSDDGAEAGSCDEDGDGHTAVSCGGDDCDDENADAYPGAVESCDGIDENCDGNADRLPDGGFDPLADAPCVDRYSEGGTVVRAPHCYLRGTMTPCGSISMAFPFDGACYGCWQRSGHPVSCAEWCSGANICSGSCDPAF